MPSVSRTRIGLKPRKRPSFLDERRLTAIEAKEKAQLIAFGPVVFKVALAMRNLGVLASVERAGEVGLTFAELEGSLPLSPYALRVLVDGGLQVGLLESRDDRLTLSRTGYFVLNDSMTRVNFNFVNEVWYRGLDHLEAALQSGKPEGLRELGSWPTIYRALSELPDSVRQSWLEFDHFYSDDAFPALLPLVFRARPRRLLDIGGNTGKYSRQCVHYDPEVEVTIVDLPGQIALAQKNLAYDSQASRIHFFAADMLNPDVTLPAGADVIWMSQFLDCFSPEEIVQILRSCRRAMQPHTLIYIVEPLTDLQRFEGSAFTLHMTSLYFTCMANGNSRMYSSVEMRELAEQAGLRVREIVSGLGICQVLMVLELPGNAPSPG